MANNFIPWLGSTATTSPQQANYEKIMLTGFEAGGFVKAEDFNAALRMTTLVCAGIASAFGFDSLTIDASEETITNKIKNPAFESLAVYGSVNISGTLYAEGISGGSGTVSSRVVSAETLEITTGGTIDASKNGTIRAQSITANVITGNAAITTEQLNAGSITASAGTITGLSSTTIDTSTIEVDNINAKTAGKITVGTTLSATTIEGSSVTIGTGSEKTEISSSGITTNNLTAAGGTISSNNITATDTLTGKSLVINGVTRISDIGSIKAGWLTVGESSSDGVEITGDGNITASGTLTGNSLEVGGDITTEGSISSKSNLHVKNSIIVGGSHINTGIERINNKGIMFPACLNLLHIKNCAQISGDMVTFESTSAADGMEFGCNLPTSISSNNRSYIFLVFMGIRVAGSGSWESFHSDYSGLLTANDTDGRQATIIFNIYSGDGASVGSNWGTVRISYQPYSLSASTGCYLSYEGPSGFSGTINIEVKMYPIAIFG